MDEKFNKFLQEMCDVQIAAHALTLLENHLLNKEVHETLAVWEIEELLSKFKMQGKEKISPLQSIFKKE